MRLSNKPKLHKIMLLCLYLIPILCKQKRSVAVSPGNVALPRRAATPSQNDTCTFSGGLLGKQVLGQSGETSDTALLPGEEIGSGSLLGNQTVWFNPHSVFT